MKRSSIAVLGFGLLVATGCSNESARRAPDPCDKASFNEQACQEAIHNHGYHSYGSWVPMNYPHPYPYYYNSYGSYITSGGSRYVPPAGAYSAAPAARGGGVGAPASSVSRGGFGGIGSGVGGGE